MSTKTGHSTTDMIVDIGSHTPDLTCYSFAAQSGTVTLTGFYTTIYGAQLGNRVTYSITTSTDFTALANPIPTGAAGFIGTLSGPLWMNLSGTILGTNFQTPNSSDISVPAGFITFGKVGGLTQGINLLGAVQSAGSTGIDYSANQPTLPNLGSNFAASGPYASYALLKTIPANLARNCIDIENVSGAQIAVVIDDGTATTGNALSNPSVFALSGAGTSVSGQQGGSWTSTTEKGRVQIFAASSAAFVSVRVN